MALQKCKECGNKVSSKASECPQCGHPVKKDSGSARWIVILGLVGLLVYCSTNDNNTPTPVSSVTNVEAEKRIAAAREKGDALIAEFNTDRAIVFADAKVLLAEGKYSELLEKYQKYRIARDPELEQLLICT